MSQELIEKLKKLSAKEGEVFVVEVREDFLEDEARMNEARAFAADVHQVTGKDVFVLAEGYKLVVVDDPRVT